MYRASCISGNDGNDLLHGRVIRHTVLLMAAPSQKRFLVPDDSYSLSACSA